MRCSSCGEEIVIRFSGEKIVLDPARGVSLCPRCVAYGGGRTYPTDEEYRRLADVIFDVAAAISALPPVELRRFEDAMLSVLERRRSARESAMSYFVG